jgi:hypothetical protein
MMDTKYCDKAIPLVAVDDKTGSKLSIIIQNIILPIKLSSSLGLFLDPLELYQLPDFIELENRIYLIECYSIEVTDLE